VRPKTAAEKAFITLGPAAGAFLTGSAASGNTKLAADLDELAALQAAHGDPTDYEKYGPVHHAR
jgi:hypothetical protein